jgi:hypothetical protein
MCGNCRSMVSVCCAQWTQCDGEDLDNNNSGCACGIANWTPGGGYQNPFCQRKPSIWTLFASR